MTMQTAIKKIGPVKTAIGAIVLLALIGGGALLLSMRPEEPASGPAVGTPETATAEDALDDLSISAPDLDFSVSPLGELGLSAFDLGTDMSGDLFGNVRVSSDFGYGGGVTLSTPDVELSAPTDINIQAPAQPAAPPEQPPGGQSGPPQVSPGACAQFSSVPSCSYVSDPNGQDLCNQCKAAGY